jgi:hypothetical protein
MDCTLFLRRNIWYLFGTGFGASSSGGRQAPTSSPQQLKEVIQWHIQSLVRSQLRGPWAMETGTQASCYVRGRYQRL